jgi:hypothetical protein
LSAVAVLVGGFAAASCGRERVGEGSGCAEVVVWHGERLPAIAVDDLPQRWPRPVGQVEVMVPPCSDDGTDAPGWQRWRATRLRGVSPGLGLARLDEAGDVDRLYLAEGYFLQLPAHPLHTGRYGSAAAPDERRGRRCRSLRIARGRVTAVSGWVGRLQVAGASKRRRSWRVDAKTTIIGAPRRAGVPRVQRGQRVVVAGVRCGARRFVARRIVVAR